MRRSTALGLLAFYPLVAVLLVGLLPEGAFVAPAEAQPLWRFVVEWWFGLVVASVLAVAVFFSAHASRRAALPAWRRSLWVLGFWTVGVLVFPAYWWREGHAT